MTAAGAAGLVVALFGPTSSGKTRLSIELAQRLHARAGVEAVVLSADSRQVYSYMDIGTSKTTREQMRGVPHELLDLTEPDHKLELESYADLARQRIEAHHRAGRLPLLVGGTGVYLASVLEGWDVGDTASVRAALERDFPRGMAADAYQTLRRLDRQAASRVHPNNYEGILNALTKVMATSTDSAQHADSAQSGLRRVVLGMDPPSRVLDQRITETFDEQLRLGLFAEVCTLAERYGLDDEMRRFGVRSRNQVLRTHGYREFFEVALERAKPVSALSGNDLAEVRGRVLEHISAYARRQRSWLRKLPDVRRVTDAEQAFRIVASELTKDRRTRNRAGATRTS